ncbi:MAG: 4-(cytidine 5'-diphospho)-2-C-methyl-D-erythritol kinase [Oscillospiraceae bacterium]|nr:4-(cytidine 5'-diphospho)-2-C-methyl-D-erythritol kinase [Oscillospiraceae bacterium]
MREIQERAYAKLNLSLDVTARREDGFHELAMLMQTVSVCDVLTLSSNDEETVSASCSLHFIPTDERNLAVRAANAYRTAVGEKRGVHIRMEKRIPVGAGMGGGSADAAAVLRGMNRLFDGRLNRRELEKLACSVGSDVAFCIAGGSALARGRGELLEDLPPLPDCRFVIVKPDFSISTPELYRKVDSVVLRRHPDTQGLLQAMEQGKLREICMRMYNVFEDVPDRRMRTVSEIKGKLLDHGAFGAMMTGTGSAVFGVFEGTEKAGAACAALGKEYRFCAVTEPVARYMD